MVDMMVKMVDILVAFLVDHHPFLPLESQQSLLQVAVAVADIMVVAQVLAVVMVVVKVLAVVVV